MTYTSRINPKTLRKRKIICLLKGHTWAEYYDRYYGIIEYCQMCTKEKVIGHNTTKIDKYIYG